MTPESAYRVLFVRIRPVAETPLVPTEHEGHFRIAAHDYPFVLDTFDWDELYNHSRVLDVVPPAVAPSRAADGPAIEDSHLE